VIGRLRDRLAVARHPLRIGSSPQAAQELADLLGVTQRVMQPGKMARLPEDHNGCVQEQRGQLLSHHGRTNWVVLSPQKQHGLRDSPQQFLDDSNLWSEEPLYWFAGEEGPPVTAARSPDLSIARSVSMAFRRFRDWPCCASIPISGGGGPASDGGAIWVLRR
jgi:hypothetical protein